MSRIPVKSSFSQIDADKHKSISRDNSVNRFFSSDYPFLDQLPWAGATAAALPMIDPYEAKNNGCYKGHRQVLDTLTSYETFSSLLPQNIDAQRDGDLGDAYFNDDTGWGNMFPQFTPMRRKLQSKGISFSLFYKGEFMDNFHGGMRAGGDDTHQVNFNMNFDLGRLLGLRNWFIHAVIYDRAGRTIAKDRVGEYLINFEDTMETTGRKSFQLEDLYAEKRFLEDKIDIAFGRMSLTHYFGQSPLLCTFMTSCSAPTAMKLNDGMYAYSDASWGGKIMVRPTRDTRIQVGAFQIYPSGQDLDGWGWGSETPKGVSLPVELSWTPFLTKNHLVGHYKVGFMHDTSSHNDLYTGDTRALSRAYSSTGRSGITPTQMHHKSGDCEGRDTLWFQMEQMMYRSSGVDQMSGGYFLDGFIHSTPRVTTLDDEAYGGISLSGLIQGRGKDRFGLLYEWYHISDRKRSNESIIMKDARTDNLSQAMVLGEIYGHFGTLGPKVKGIQSTTDVIETYYMMEMEPGLRVQPTFIYQIKPGETGHIPDAAMLGMKVMGNF